MKNYYKILPVLFLIFSGKISAQSFLSEDRITTRPYTGTKVVSPYRNNIAVVKKYEICDEYPEMIVDVASYEDIANLPVMPAPEPSHYCASYNFQNKQGKVTSPVWFSEIYEFGKERIRVKQNDIYEKYGYADQNGKLIIPCSFSSAEPFSNNTAIVRNGEGWHWIDKQGKFISEAYHKIFKWNNYYIAYSDGKGVMCFSDGKIFTDTYDVLIPVSDTLLLHVKNRKSVGAFLFKNNQLSPYKNIIPLTDYLNSDRMYVYINIITDHPQQIHREIIQGKNVGVTSGGKILYASQNSLTNKYAVMDAQGNVLSKYYDKIGFAVPDYYLVEKDKTFGLIDSTGKEVIPVQYEWIEPMAGVYKWEQRKIYTFLRVKKPGQGIGLCTIYGEELLRPVYSNIDNFDKTSGTSLVTREDKNPRTGERTFRTSQFLIDSNGVRLSKTYDHIEYFQEGLVEVIKKDLHGYINAKGQEVIAPQFEDADKFSEGFAAVKINGKYGYIDRTGKIVIEPKYSRVYNFRNGQAEVWNENNYRFYINTKGELVGEDQ